MIIESESTRLEITVITEPAEENKPKPKKEKNVEKWFLFDLVCMFLCLIVVICAFLFVPDLKEYTEYQRLAPKDYYVEGLDAGTEVSSYDLSIHMAEGEGKDLETDKPYTLLELLQYAETHRENIFYTNNARLMQDLKGIVEYQLLVDDIKLYKSYMSRGTEEEQESLQRKVDYKEVQKVALIKKYGELITTVSPSFTANVTFVETNPNTIQYQVCLMLSLIFGLIFGFMAIGEYSKEKRMQS